MATYKLGDEDAVLVVRLALFNRERHRCESKMLMRGSFVSHFSLALPHAARTQMPPKDYNVGLPWCTSCYATT